MTKQEILDRVKDMLNQYPGEIIGDLDLLRHDLENDIIEGEIEWYKEYYNGYLMPLVLSMY